MAQFDLIIFDCDGVLVDSEILARRAVQSVFRQAGIEITAEMVDAVVGMKFADLLAGLEARTGRRLSEDYHPRFWTETKAIFSTELLPVPGVVDFLERSDLPRCVASSSDHNRIRHSLSVTKLDRFFPRDAIFSSHDVQRGKPEPDLVLYAAARMGADPARCLVIEDSRFGIQGAKSAGMTAYGFLGGAHLLANTGETLRAAGADFVARTWDDISAEMRR
ncbi:HAD family hydrolase [Aureimonas jatrophae]|uniref:Haloacid dehalogenase superfamily, subfamily IA, variant 3 with third motif having DD or ED n=1 Tax=Aureimonas jatrophae TaxID=1166073 RepID=A0A1H0L9L6_9HYPH|nr:HAD family hydrolase [Aureimonas jatrophae]MBB3952467.1 HAD superfamily hydrolase (TIGR01509 family) [Aureimonas jatrophae]SDO64888.1 haloacid dehalogenase superfamily, subfamily IA, variant 3 with third motif having DD or ED [Aureimonas jatrophae]